ncbi:MAG: histidine phosphatase family protein [Dermatophilaceae bacterium]
MESTSSRPAPITNPSGGLPDLSHLDNSGLPKPLWTQEEGINREVAEDIIGDLVVVRHGQSTANVAFAQAAATGLLDAGVTGRDVDVELSTLGWQQAAALGRWLSDPATSWAPDVVFSSPYRRARHTWQRAADVAATGGRPVPAALTDDRLGDRRMGQLELMTPAAVAHQYGAEIARRLAVRDFSYRPPEGESFTDIADRVRSLVADLHRDHPGQRVLLVAHDAVVLMLRFVLEQLTVEQLAVIAETQPVANASITRFVARQGGMQLDRYNLIDHLDGVVVDSAGGG